VLAVSLLFFLRAADAAFLEGRKSNASNGEHLRRLGNGNSIKDLVFLVTRYHSLYLEGFVLLVGLHTLIGGLPS
jgi:hypothetical protein